MKYKYVACIICTKCDDRVYSYNRHDCRYCSCGACYIDGGRDYTRIGYLNSDYPPKSTRMRVSVKELEKNKKGEPRWPY